MQISVQQGVALSSVNIHNFSRNINQVQKTLLSNRCSGVNAYTMVYVNFDG